MTKIDIVSGFLGAGKTTLIKKLLSEALNGTKVVLIENEFGEIGVDGGFLKDAGIEIREMNSGCICCSLVGDFTTSLEEVIEKYAPERVLIEPSGVGKLSDVQRAVLKASEAAGVEPGSSVAVVDASKCKIYMKNFGEFFIDQIEHAGTIILSRTQNMSEEKLEAVVAMIREHNKDAKIVTTPWDELTGAYILETFEAVTSFEEELLEEFKHEHEHDDDDDDDDDDDEHEHHHHHHHEHKHEGESEDEYGIGTFIYYRRTPFDREKLRKYVNDFPRNIIRSKGLAWFSDEYNTAYVFETSGRQVLCGPYGMWIASAPPAQRKEILANNPQIRADWDDKVGDRMVRLCIIGKNLDKKKIAAELDACLAK